MKGQRSEVSRGDLPWPDSIGSVGHGAAGYFHVCSIRSGQQRGAGSSGVFGGGRADVAHSAVQMDHGGL